MGLAKNGGDIGLFAKGSHQHKLKKSPVSLVAIMRPINMLAQLTF